MRAWRVELAPPAAAAVRALHPEIRAAVRAALGAIAAQPALGTPLLRELAGLRKYRVRRFRIVYAVDHRDRRIRVIAVGHRRSVYEALAGQRP